MPVVAAAVAVELFQIKPVRPVVVVHHVDVHGDPAAVRLPDEFAQGIGSSVGPFDTVKIGGIVTPAVVAVEFVHRHEEDAIHPEFLEVVQTAGGIAQGGHFAILGRGVVEGARVQLVNYQVARLAGRRHGVFPVEGGRIMYHRLAGIGQLASPRVAPLELAVDQKHVFAARFCLGQSGTPHAGRLIQGHFIRRRPPMVEFSDDRHRLGMGCPDAERGAENFSRPVAMEGRTELVAAQLGHDCHGCCAGRLRTDRWRGGRRPGHFLGRDFTQICCLVGKSQRALPVADQHATGLESGKCHLPSPINLHAAGRASFVNDRKDDVFAQSEFCRLTVRIFDQPGHGVRWRGHRLGCRLGFWLRGR